MLLLLLLTGAALAGPDNGDHDPRPLPQIVETSAEGAASCHLSQEERARLLRFLDQACTDDWHACALAGHVRGMQLAGECEGPRRQRLLVALLGILLLGWLIWMGVRSRNEEITGPRGPL